MFAERYELRIPWMNFIQICTGTVFSPGTSVFPCQYHSSNAPYWATPDRPLRVARITCRPTQHTDFYVYQDCIKRARGWPCAVWLRVVWRMATVVSGNMVPPSSREKEFSGKGSGDAVKGYVSWPLLLGTAFFRVAGSLGSLTASSVRDICTFHLRTGGSRVTWYISIYLRNLTGSNTLLFQKAVHLKFTAV